MKKKMLLILATVGAFSNAQEKVGINTKAPLATLDVNGNMNIRKLGAYVETSTPISWNPETRMFSIDKLDNNIKVQTFFIGVNPTVGKGKFENTFVNLNTGIDSNKYEVFVTGWDYDKWGTESPNKLGYNHVKYSENKLNPLPIIRANVGDDGKWHLVANFACSYNEDWRYGPAYWNIETLIMPKGYAQHKFVEGFVSEDANDNYNPNGTLSKNPLGDINIVSSNTNENEDNEVQAGGVQAGVGIATDNPSASLDVQGNVALTTVENPSPNGVDYLRRNNSTGEVIKSNLAGGKPMHVLKFFIPTDRNAENNNDKDRVAMFDTKIPVKDYYVIVSSADFTKGNSSLDSTPEMSVSHETTGGENYNPVKRALATDTNDDGTKRQTWGLKLDYVNAGPSQFWLNASKSEGVAPAWNVETLVISKDFVQDIELLNKNGVYNKTTIVNDSGQGTFSGNVKGLPEVKK